MTSSLGHVILELISALQSRLVGVRAALKLDRLVYFQGGSQQLVVDVVGFFGSLFR